jgi:transcriptional regulator with XRE-family HTH domain
MTRSKNKIRNQLWLARKRLGLGQKQVAHLLSHKTTDQVSRYENGQRVPGLKMLLQFEIIYGLPARVLFRDYYEKLRLEITNRTFSVKSISKPYTVPQLEAQAISEFCAYGELLQNPRLTQVERDQIRSHVVLIMRRLSAI